MSQSAAFLDIGYTPENDEDVCHVPGSIGTAGPVVTPWAPRRSPASDRARAEAMAALAPLFSKHRRPAPSRAPAAPADFWQARENYLKRKTNG